MLNIVFDDVIDRNITKKSGISEGNLAHRTLVNIKQIEFDALVAESMPTDGLSSLTKVFAAVLAMYLYLDEAHFHSPFQKGRKIIYPLLLKSKAHMGI